MIKKIGLCKLYHISACIVKFFNSFQFSVISRQRSVCGPHVSLEYHEVRLLIADGYFGIF